MAAIAVRCISILPCATWRNEGSTRLIPPVIDPDQSAHSRGAEPTSAGGKCGLLRTWQRRCSGRFLGNQGSIVPNFRAAMGEGVPAESYCEANNGPCSRNVH